MTTKEENERLGQQLAQRLRPLADSEPVQKFNAVNPEWAEADRLGRLLLDTIAANESSRLEISIEIPNQGENQ